MCLIWVRTSLKNNGPHNKKEEKGVEKWTRKKKHRTWIFALTQAHTTTRRQCERPIRRNGFKSMLAGFSWSGHTGKHLWASRGHIWTKLRWISEDSTMIRWRGCSSKQPIIRIPIHSRAAHALQKKYLLWINESIFFVQGLNPDPWEPLVNLTFPKRYATPRRLEKSPEGGCGSKEISIPLSPTSRSNNICHNLIYELFTKHRTLSIPAK